MTHRRKHFFPRHKNLHSLWPSPSWAVSKSLPVLQFRLIRWSWFVNICLEKLLYLRHWICNLFWLHVEVLRKDLDVHSGMTKTKSAANIWVYTQVWQRPKVLRIHEYIHRNDKDKMCCRHRNAHTGMTKTKSTADSGMHTQSWQRQKVLQIQECTPKYDNKAGASVRGCAICFSYERTHRNDFRKRKRKLTGVSKTHSNMHALAHRYTRTHASVPANIHTNMCQCISDFHVCWSALTHHFASCHREWPCKIRKLVEEGKEHANIHTHDCLHAHVHTGHMVNLRLLFYHLLEHSQQKPSPQFIPKKKMHVHTHMRAYKHGSMNHAVHCAFPCLLMSCGTNPCQPLHKIILDKHTRTHAHIFMHTHMHTTSHTLNFGFPCSLICFSTSPCKPS